MPEYRRGVPFELWAVAIASVVVWWYTERGGGPIAWPTLGSTESSFSLAGVGTAVASFLFKALLWLLGAAVLAGLLFMLSRAYWRRQRAKQMVYHEIVLGPSDEAEPFEVMGALDAIHMMLFTRYARDAYGQDYWTFEIIRDSLGVVHFVIGGHRMRIERIEQILRSKYTNIRFIPWENEERHDFRYLQQVVLRKPFHLSTETVRDYTSSVVESIVQLLDAAEGPVHLQYHMTPLPMEKYHRAVQARVRHTEYRLRKDQAFDPAAPGVGYVEDKLQKNSLQLMGRGVYRTEIRLAANTWGDVQGVFGALSEANDQNSFRAATIFMFRGLWKHWMYNRLPSLFLFKWSVMFSFPLATIIHLPTNRLRTNSLVRSLVRRAPTPRAIPHHSDPESGIVQDTETGAYVSIPEGDRESNLLIIGSQGSGKTTDLLNVFRIDARLNSDKAVVLIDIGKDTSKRALGLVPPGRRVIYFAPGDPKCPWSINPLRAAVSDAVVADNVLEALTQVFGEDAIQSRSREFLGNAVMAIRNVEGDKGDFVSMYRLLTDSNYLRYISRNVTDPHQIQYWQHTFPASIEADKRWMTEGLSAPRNKLDEVLRNPLIRAVFESSDRHVLDMRDVIRDKTVLIVNLDKSKLGDEGTRLLGIMLIQQLWYALQAQNELEERERTRVSLILDESQNYMSDGFLDMLAEGRAYGLQTTLALRFLGELSSEKVIDGLHALVQNVIIHQFQLLREAEEFMKKFMRVYANLVQVTAQSQDMLNFGADDIMRLPKFTVICQWMVGGSVQQAFLARTINWEQFYRDDWRKHHLSRQPIVIEAEVVPDVPEDEPQIELLEKFESESGHSEQEEVVLTAGEPILITIEPEPDSVPANSMGDGHGGRVIDWEELLVATEESSGGHAAVFFIPPESAEGEPPSTEALCNALPVPGALLARKGCEGYVALLPGLDEAQAASWAQGLRLAGWRIGCVVQEEDEFVASAVNRAQMLAVAAEAVSDDGGVESGPAATDESASGNGTVEFESDGHAEVSMADVAGRMGVSVRRLESVVKRLHSKDAEVAIALRRVAESGLKGNDGIAAFERELLAAIGAETVAEAKRFTARRFKMSEEALNATLAREELDDQRFVAFARAYFKDNAGSDVALADFVAAWRERLLTEDVRFRAAQRRLSNQTSLPLKEVRAVLIAGGVHPQRIEDLAAELKLRYPNGATKDEFSKLCSGF